MSRKKLSTEQREKRRAYNRHYYATRWERRAKKAKLWEEQHPEAVAEFRKAFNEFIRMRSEIDADGQVR
jgi:hypothetical protein